MSTAIPIPEGVTANIEIVDVAQAKAWLDQQRKNRPLNDDTWMTYARDVEGERWEFNGETVKFDREGYLIDGQHRLTSIVVTGIALPLLVVRGLAVKPEVQATVDIGRKRTVANTLAMFKGKGAYAAHLAALARLILERDGQSHPSPAEQLELIEKDPSIHEIAVDIIGSMPKFPGLTKTWGAYCYWRLNQIDSAATKEFFESLANLSDLPAGSPILALHKRLLNQPKGAGRYVRDSSLALVFSAWNAWRKGEKRTKIQTPGLRNGKVAIPDPI